MRYPYIMNDSSMEGYFPERDALQHELDKLNQVIKSHRASEVWKKFSLSTSNDEYGGVHHMSKKERERGPYFNPWYKSSNEIGKYAQPMPKKDSKNIQQMLGEQKSQQKEAEKNTRPKADRSHSESNAVALPEIKTNQAAHHSVPPTGEASKLTTTWPKTGHSQVEASMNYQHIRHDLRTGPVKNYMTNPMGRLWQNMNEIPGATGKEKRVSPKKRSPIRQVKLPPVDHTLRYGVGKSMGVPKCSHDQIYKDMSIPSADSKGSSLN